MPNGFLLGRRQLHEFLHLLPEPREAVYFPLCLYPDWEGRFCALFGKVDHIAVDPAAEAVEVVLVQLHAGRAVGVKGAADHAAPPDFQAAVPGGFLHGHCRFDLCKQIDTRFLL